MNGNPRDSRPLSAEEIATSPVIMEPGQAEAERITKARGIVASCKPIAGTPAQAYLARRGIDAAALPKGVVGWHEESRALVCPALGKDGAVVACQRLFFNACGEPTIEKNGKKKRRTNGVLRGAAMAVPGTADGVLVCEGAEDGLTLWQATRQHVRIAFGKAAMGAVPLPDGEPVVIVADNDKAGIEGAHAAAAMLVERGHAVKIAAARWRQGCERAARQAWRRG